MSCFIKSVFRHKTSFQSVSWFMKAYPVDTKAALLLIMTNWWDWVDKLLRWDQPLCVFLSQQYMSIAQAIQCVTPSRRYEIGSGGSHQQNQNYSLPICLLSYQSWWYSQKFKFAIGSVGFTNKQMPKSVLILNPMNMTHPRSGTLYCWRVQLWLC